MATADTKRLCSKCWTQIDDEDEEAAYLGLSVQALRAIRNYEKPKVFRRRKRGNRYVKFNVQFEKMIMADESI